MRWRTRRIAHNIQEGTMRTRGCNRLVIQQQDDEEFRHYIEQMMENPDNSAAQPYIEQLMENRNNSEAQSDDDQSNELNSSVGGTEKFSIPKRAEEFFLKSLGKKWKDYKCDLKGEYIAKYKTKDTLLKNRLSHIPRDQWSGLVSYWFSDKAKDSSNEDVQRLEQEITELKAKQIEEMNSMKQNQEKMQSQLLQMRQFMSKYAPNEFRAQNINGTSSEHVPVADSGHERVPQTSRMPSVAENTPPSHGTTHLCPSPVT
ncbi:hypothetical protein RND71_034452 [Anisodus tanguticus]|uniref:Uncharacterized protein n=1 Tax=Anisodus tanguticus TaxID=243964 RepID=A0AAE1UX20_9SOLA|nr:hypothetical protein RND71_034452 [Anisodus tanguticus]